LPIRFLLAHSPGLNFGRISDPQLHPSSCSRRSNQRECPLDSMPTRADTFRCCSSR
jgi:hypothetical protein